MTELSAKIVREFLEYRQDTGEIIWKTRDVRWFASERTCRSWNARFAGKSAGCSPSAGYTYVGILGRQYCAHRVIWLHQTGNWPDDQIDHINGDRFDNRWANLRESCHADNSLNCGMSARNTSGFKGVTRSGSRWMAMIGTTVGGVRKMKYLGTRKTAREAHELYAAAAAELGFSARHINGDISWSQRTSGTAE